MSEKHSDGQGSDSTTETKETGFIKDGKYAWLFYLVVGLVILFVILSWIARTKNESNEQNDDQAKATVIVAERVEQIPLSISKTRTKIDIPYGVRSIHFRNATVPYCAKNKGGEEHCSDDTEDIIGQFNEGHSTDNLVFWVSSQGAEGTITVELTYFTN